MGGIDREVWAGSQNLSRYLKKIVLSLKIGRFSEPSSLIMTTFPGSDNHIKGLGTPA